MLFILIEKLKYGTKEISKVFSIVAIGLGLIIAIILIKYKPTYEVKVQGETIGYIEDEESFAQKINGEIVSIKEGNIDAVTLNNEPEYELKLISRNKETNEEQIIAKLKEDVSITYKYFAVTLDNQVKSYVNTLEEATKVVEDIKKENEKDIDLNLQVIETYTQNSEEINSETVEVAETNLQNEVNTIIKEKGPTKINGIKIASMPIDTSVSTIISSRFGEISRIRYSAHKGLDIACSTGTPIKAIAEGTILYSGYDNTGLGYVVKIDHGNGVQTWYAHCSKLYVKTGDYVNAGDTISAVGSTGNSTGPHLHFEVRTGDGSYSNRVNPKNYLP